MQYEFEFVRRGECEHCGSLEDLFDYGGVAWCHDCIFMAETRADEEAMEDENDE